MSELITTVPWLPWVTELTTAPASKLSFARTVVVIALSSFVVTLSAVISWTFSTVTLTVAVSVTPPLVTV